MNFSDLFSNGKSSESGPWRLDWAAQLGSTVDQGDADKRARQRLPAAVEEDKLDEAVSEGCSPEHERRNDRDEERRWLELGARVKEGARELGREGKKGW
jgi:phage protein D